MKIVANYSFNGGEEFILKFHKEEFRQVEEIIGNINAEACKTKVSEEKTMEGKILYAPKVLNKCFKEAFVEKKWQTGYRINVKTEVPEIGTSHKGFREMDAVKNKLGVEVQLGKYAFMVYNVAAKMTIFANLGIINSGIEIVPMLSLANDMSTGVSYFEQMKTDLEMRGVSNIDIPVLILGIAQGESSSGKEIKRTKIQQLIFDKLNEDD